MGFFDFGGEGEAGDGGELHHPWLVVVVGEGGEEAVEEIDGEDGGERGEGVVGGGFEDPIDGFFSGEGERGVDGGLGLFGEEGVELVVVPEEVLLEEGEGDGVGVNVVIVGEVLDDVVPLLFGAVEGVDQGFLLNRHWL